MDPNAPRSIAKSLATKAYDVNNNLIIKTDQEIRDILHSRYNSRPDSEDQYDENGSYHFDNLNIDRICTIYNTLMDKYPKTKPQVRFRRRLTFSERPSPELHHISHPLNLIFNDMNIEEQLPEF